MFHIFDAGFVVVFVIVWMFYKTEGDFLVLWIPSLLILLQLVSEEHAKALTS